MLGSAVLGAAQIVPTPQYLESVDDPVVLRGGSSVQVVIGPDSRKSSRKMNLAFDFLRRALLEADPTIQVRLVAAEDKPGGVQITLWDFAADSKPPVSLNFLDLEAITNTRHAGQGYVIRTSPSGGLSIIGGSEQGVLLGTMSLLQLVRKSSKWS